MVALKRFRNILIAIVVLLMAGFLVWVISTDASSNLTTVAIGVAALSALFSAVSAVAAWVQADEARKQRELQERPYISGSFKGSYGGFLYFDLQNSGNSPAVNVKVRFDPSPVDARGRSLNEVSLFNKPISFFPHGQSYRQLIDAGHRFLSEGNPTEFRVDLTYETVFGEIIKDKIEYDLAYLKDAHIPGRTIEESLDQIAKQMKSLDDLFKKVEKGGSLIIQTRAKYDAKMKEILEQRQEAKREDS